MYGAYALIMVSVLGEWWLNILVTQEALVLHRLLDQRQTSVEDVDAMGEGKASNNL